MALPAFQTRNTLQIRSQALLPCDYPTIPTHAGTVQ